MRTIKFRGKRLDGKGWVVGYPLEKFQEIDGEPRVVIDTCRAFANNGYHSLEQYEAIPESVGQWTGKFDINGVEIYQGDIVNSGHLKADEWIPSIAVIEWDEDFAMFRQVLKGVNEGLEQLMDVPCEVIGNITDSPELMEVE